MPKTGAERQQAWQRQARHAAALEAHNAQLRADLARVRADLAGALAEAERLTAQQCKHPAAAVDGGHCHACGNDIW